LMVTVPLEICLSVFGHDDLIAGWMCESNWEIELFVS